MSRKVASGHLVEEIGGEEAHYLRNNYYMYIDGVMRLRPGDWILPTNFIKYSGLIRDFKVRPTDVFVLTYPKSGTTWIQEIVWNLVHNPDGGSPMANLSLDARFPNIEVDMFLANTGAPPPDPNGDPMKMFRMVCPGKHYSEGIAVALAEHSPDPRMLKAHVPLAVLPPDLLTKAKVIYVAREPKDVITSNFHFARLQMMWGFKGDFDHFLDDFINGTAPFGPYWNHVKLAYDQRDHPNMCFVYFEDLKQDALEEIRRIDRFLGTNRSDQQIRNVAEMTSFAQMKERSKRNPPTSNDNTLFNKVVEETEGGFFRKGEIGDWKNRINTEQLKKVNAWIAENLTAFGNDFKYKSMYKDKSKTDS